MQSKSETPKITAFQKTLLIRWINTLDIYKELLTINNIMEEIKSGVLLCEILHFHAPKLDLTTGLNYKAISKKACINNVEKCMQALYQTGAPRRNIPAAEQVFESEKNQSKIWILLKLVFDIFAMADVNKLAPYILKWINMSLQYFGH